MKTTKSILLAESGIMLAFATILSLIEIIKLPYGGGITAFSMLPVILIAYRRGAKWGLFSALAFSLIQMLMGLQNLSYATSAGAAAAIILLDYIVAFTVLGLGGAFRNMFKSQSGGLAAGTLMVCALRYGAHVLVGFTVWRDISIPPTDALIYSIIYNATYMLPETLVTLIGAVTLSKLLDFRGEGITRAVPQAKAPDLAVLFSGLAKTFIAIAGVVDIVLVFSKIQNSDSGKFDITRIAEVNKPLFAAVTVAAALLAVTFFIQAKRVPSDSDVDLKWLFTALPIIGVAAAAVFDIIFIILTLGEGKIDRQAVIKISVVTIAVLAASYAIIRNAISKKR